VLNGNNGNFAKDDETCPIRGLALPVEWQRQTGGHALSRLVKHTPRGGRRKVRLLTLRGAQALEEAEVVGA
jgi:hypothetical protein